jgi:hypothetical protein
LHSSPERGDISVEIDPTRNIPELRQERYCALRPNTYLHLEIVFAVEATQNLIRPDYKQASDPFSLEGLVVD